MKNNINWIFELKQQGYNFICRLDSNESEIYATKSKKTKSTNDLRSNAVFDIFKLGDNDNYPYRNNTLVEITNGKY